MNGVMEVEQIRQQVRQAMEQVCHMFCALCHGMKGPIDGRMLCGHREPETQACPEDCGHPECPMCVAEYRWHVYFEHPGYEARI